MYFLVGRKTIPSAASRQLWRRGEIRFPPPEETCFSPERARSSGSEEEIPTPPPGFFTFFGFLPAVSPGEKSFSSVLRIVAGSSGSQVLRGGPEGGDVGR